MGVESSNATVGTWECPQKPVWVAWPQSVVVAEASGGNEVTGGIVLGILGLYSFLSLPEPS